MKITEVTASCSRTFQVADYEPVNFHVSMKAELEEKESRSDAFAKLFIECKRQVNMQISAVADKTTPLVGLPDGYYVVYQNGVKKIVTVKKGKAPFYSPYIAGDVQTRAAVDISSKCFNN